MIRFVEISLMKSFFSNNRYPLLLTFLSLIWVLAVVFVFQVFDQRFVFGDSKSYYWAAVELYSNGTLNDHRPLVISAINGFPLLFGFSGAAIFIWSWMVNLCCWLGTVLLIFSIAKRYVKSKVAFFTALTFLFCIGNLFIAFHLLSESIFTFCLVLAFYNIQIHLDSKSTRPLIFALVVLLLSIMIKPLSLILAVIVLLFFCKKWKAILKSGYSLLLYLSCGILFFQMYTMKTNFGNFTVSYIDSFTYYNYLGTRADCLKNKTPFIQGENQRYAYFGKLSHTKQKEVASGDFKKQLSSNTENLIKAYAVNLVVNSTKGSAAVYGCENKLHTNYFDRLHFFFKAVSKLQNIILTSIGLFLSLLTFLRWKGNAILFRLGAVVFMCIVAVSAISSDQGDRFHIVLYPIILLMLSNYFPKRIPHD